MKVENKTIIITDPCYVIRHNPYPYPSFLDYGLPVGIGSKLFTDFTPEETEAYKKYEQDPYFIWENENDDWKKCSYGENMEALGITNYLTSSTIYGDWSCTTYEEGTNKKLGNFCADAGLVSVFILDEVRNYNPNIDDWISKHDWCVTVIPDFTGEVSIDIVNVTGVYEYDSEYTTSAGVPYYKKGETWNQDEVRVIGKGSINFYTTQTGL